MPSQPGIRLGIFLLLAWTLVGTAGFKLIEGWSVADSLYMTIITISTVGFGEVHPLSSGGKLFTSIIIVAGLGTVIYTLTSVAQILLEGELAKVLGRRRMKTELDKLDDHFIICGFGRRAHGCRWIEGTWASHLHRGAGSRSRGRTQDTTSVPMSWGMPPRRKIYCWQVSNEPRQSWLCWERTPITPISP